MVEMLISLAVVTVSPDLWISNITDDDVVAFGQPQTTGFGSHVIRLRQAELTEQGLEARDELLRGAEIREVDVAV
jgi:hypothetical protein